MGRRPLRLADRERAETACTKEGSVMGIGRKHLAPMLGALAAAAAIGTGPLAAGEGPLDAQQPPPPGQSCVQVGGSQFKCESPGNVQLNDAPSVTDNPC